ncbi:MAG: helix-turn-helix transcriptional regulator [Actinomycetales bacterium]|nr:helix-turn-helix transcriptional regulator [Actinomycetales bacterium]
MIGDNVRAERARRYWLQRDLAERLGRSRSVVSAIECGRRRVTPECLEELCRAFGIPARRLLYRATPVELTTLGLVPGPFPAEDEIPASPRVPRPARPVPDAATDPGQQFSTNILIAGTGWGGRW